MVDGAGHDVARGEFGARVEARHEALAVGQLEQGAFTAQCFCDQEALGLRVVQAGGVELVELQVRHPAAGAPGHGDPVAAGTVRVAGIEVDLGRPAGGQRGEAGAKGVDLAAGTVEHIGPQAALAGLAQAPFGDQVDRHALFQKLDVRALAGLLQQRGENRRASGVGRVDDAPVAVAALAGQVELEAAFIDAGLFVTGKRHALVDQPLDRLATVLDRIAHRVFMTQPAAGIERILHVGLYRVGVVEHGGNTALCPEGRAVGQLAFAQYGDAQVRRQVQGQAQAGGTAADHQNVMLELLAHVRDIRARRPLV